MTLLEERVMQAFTSCIIALALHHILQLSGATRY